MILTFTQIKEQHMLLQFILQHPFVTRVKLSVVLQARVFIVTFTCGQEHFLRQRKG